MLRLLKSGFYTSVQDRGRFGFRDKGVPVSGAMDNLAMEKANALLENGAKAAVLEITMTGPTIEFGADTYIVLAGAPMSATLNNRPIINYKVYKISAGDILSYGRLENGFRAYLAIKGGLGTETILNSRSFSREITAVGMLGDRAEIPFEACSSFEPKIPELKTDSYLDESVLHAARGPEFDMLKEGQLKAIFGHEFSIAKENDRMAYQLVEKVDGHKKSMLTSATLPGTVQLTPSGRLIILMKDGQTTGGYPRLLQLDDRSISILAQKKFGDTISFKLLRS